MINKFRAYFYLLPNIAKAIAMHPETKSLHELFQQFPDRFRGLVQIREENCIGCGLCVMDCPSKALEIKKSDTKDFLLYHYRNRCSYCGQCEISCRYDAIHLTNVLNSPSINKEDFSIILVDKKNTKITKK